MSLAQVPCSLFLAKLVSVLYCCVVVRNVVGRHAEEDGID